MQGVQPKANARPIAYAPHSPTGLAMPSRPSRISTPIRVSPRKCSPMMMMTMPAAIDRYAE